MLHKDTFRNYKGKGFKTYHVEVDSLLRATFVSSNTQRLTHQLHLATLYQEERPSEMNSEYHEMDTIIQVNEHVKVLSRHEADLMSEVRIISA